MALGNVGQACDDMNVNELVGVVGEGLASPKRYKRPEDLLLNWARDC